MSGSVVTSSLSDSLPEPQAHGDVSLGLVTRLLDTFDKSLLVSERSGRILMVSSIARKCLDSLQLGEVSRLNLFSDLLEVDPKRIFADIESGQHEVKLDLSRGEKRTRASIKWVPEPDWLVVEFEVPAGTQAAAAPDPATQITVQELLQEREITYRNLLAAYLKLQEVNRQKTVFLASAAHELKTPLAVIKGYYDLLLTSSLGRLSEKQRDILEESKESWFCSCAKTTCAIASMNSPNGGWKPSSAKACDWTRRSIPRFQTFASIIRRCSKQPRIFWTTR
jgi:signal transduction histidine kinase